jgi:hypothetical protein
LIFKMLILFLISGSVFAFDKDFRTINDRVPLEFQYLFDSIKLEVKSPSDKIRLVGICKELDENLGLLQKEHIFLLMKSEVIKNVMEYKHQKVRSFDVTSLLIKRIEEDFAKKASLLNSFSQWIYRSIIAELKLREKMGLISARSFNAGNFEGAKRTEALRFARYLTYLLPWIDKMDSLSAADFNLLTKEVSWVILRRLNQRSLLFKRFAITAASETKVTLFNIPVKLLELHPEDIKRAQSNVPPLSLKEESEKEKTEATQQIQNVSPEDLSTLSDEVSKELEQKAP